MTLQWPVCSPVCFESEGMEPEEPLSPWGSEESYVPLNLVLRKNSVNEDGSAMALDLRIGSIDTAAVDFESDLVERHRQRVQQRQREQLQRELEERRRRGQLPQHQRSPFEQRLQLQLPLRADARVRPQPDRDHEGPGQVRLQVGPSSRAHLNVMENVNSGVERKMTNRFGPTSSPSSSLSSALYKTLQYSLSKPSPMSTVTTCSQMSSNPINVSSEPPMLIPISKSNQVPKKRALFRQLSSFAASTTTTSSATSPAASGSHSSSLVPSMLVKPELAESSSESEMPEVKSEPMDEEEEDKSVFPTASTSTQPSKFAERPRGRPRNSSVCAKSSSRTPMLPPLYVFIRNLLHNRAYNPSVVSWVNEREGVFRVVQTNEFANIWGRMRTRRRRIRHDKDNNKEDKEGDDRREENVKMTYEKLSRAMRYHYGNARQGRKGHLAMMRERRLVYKFGELAINWRRHEVLQKNCTVHELCKNELCLWTKE